MKAKELEELQSILWSQLRVRRQLGGYNAEAESLIVLNEALLKIVEHLIVQESTEIEQKDFNTPAKK